MDGVFYGRCFFWDDIQGGWAVFHYFSRPQHVASGAGKRRRITGKTNAYNVLFQPRGGREDDVLEVDMVIHVPPCSKI